MFYSQCLLSKKGPLGAIWVAGCCFKRLKKRQVRDTDISSSVDKILLEGLPSVTYRILAYLLLGVVRIYSRKVEYLFEDCHETVCDINKFSVGKKTIPFKNIVRSLHSIILPERYELDAFQLDITDGPSGGNIALKEDIILQDAEKDTFAQHFGDKLPFEEDGGFTDWEENWNAESSGGVNLQQDSFIVTPGKLPTDWETTTAACTPPDKVFSPHHMETNTELTSLDPIKNLQTSKEKLRELRFHQEDHMDADMICELDVELLNLVNEYQMPKNDDKDEDARLRSPLQNRDDVILEDKEVASVAEKSPDLDIPDAAGDGTQQHLLLPTPVKMENIQRPGKRKCIFDEVAMLSNQVMKQTINDASGLLNKRRKAPHTVIDLWRLSRIPVLSKNFAEPLIPCAALELPHGQYRTKTDRAGPSKSSLNVTVEEPLVGSVEAPVKPQEVLPPRTPTESRSALAPGTPVRCPASARVFGSARAGDSDAEAPVRSYGNAKVEWSRNGVEDQDNGPNLMSEMNADEGDSQENKNKNELSTRTRAVAKYLHQVIHRKKQQGEETVTLLPMLDRKTRGENARFFYELLVLTTGGFVNVMQERAYDDVLLRETPKMEAATFVN